MTLTDMAEQLAESMQAQATYIESQLADVDAEQTKLDARKAQLLLDREAARNASKRFASFDGNSCPYCCIRRGENGALRPLDGTNDVDSFRCTRCNEVMDVDL